MPANEIKVVLIPGDRELPSGDHRWPAELRPLRQTLRLEGIALEERDVPGPGDKGMASESLIVLAESMIPTAVTVLFEWLRHRRTRTLTINIEHGDESVTMDLTGDATAETLQNAMLAALRREPERTSQRADRHTPDTRER